MVDYSVRTGATWKYNRPDTSNNGLSYSQVGYNDAAWASGTTPFIASPSYSSVTSGPGGTTMPFPLSLWMRIEFTVPPGEHDVNWQVSFDNFGELWIDGSQTLPSVYASNGPGDPGFRQGVVRLPGGKHACASKGQGDSSVGDSVSVQLLIPEYFPPTPPLRVRTNWDL